MSWEGRVFLLGTVRATHDGHEAVLAGSQPRLVLAYTALQRGRDVPIEELAEVLWGDHPARHWAGALRGVVAKVRAFLSELGVGAPTLENVGHGYRFTGDDVTVVDLWQAEISLARAEEALTLGRCAEAVEEARVASSLLAAPLLLGIDAGWLAPWRTCLDRDRRRARRLASAAHIELGQFDEAIDAASVAVGENAYDEESQRALMAAYRAAGNRAAALRSYGECRRLLADDLGVAPDAQTEAMYMELLADEGRAGGPRRGGSAITTLLTDQRFVGRIDALAEIDAAWQAARRGHPQVVLLQGEAGVGKTRLVLEAARRADPENLLYGRSGTERVVPFEAFAEAIGPHLADGRDPEMTDLIMPYRDELAGLIPVLGATTDGPVVWAPEEDHRLRVLDAVRSVIEHISEEPTILVLDDLHWADVGTLLLLRHLVTTIERGSLLVVCTYRGDQDLDRAELAEAIAGLRVLDRCRVIEVDGLEVAEVVELLSVNDVADAERLGPLWWQRTRGNGFYLTQILIARDESSCFDPLAVPDTVNELVRHRLATLSVDAREVAASAAVIGAAFPLSLLARVVVAGGGSLDGVDELLSRNLLIEGGDGIGFAHAIVRDAVYEQLSRSRRRRLHLRVAEAIDELVPCDPEWAAALAHHLLLADDPSRVEHLVVTLLMAGDHASRRQSFEHAAELYELALTHMACVPGDAGSEVRSAGPGDPRLAATHAALGGALRRAGELPRARTALQAAIELARHCDQPGVLADAVLELVARGWRGAEIDMADGDRADLLHEAIDGLHGTDDRDGRSGDPRRLVRLLVELAKALTASGDDAGCRDAAGQAWAVAQSSDRADLQAIAVEAHRLLLTDPDDASARLAATDALVGARAAELTQVQMARLRMWRLSDCLELGDRRGLDRELWSLIDLARELHHPYWDWVVTGWRVLLTFLAGDAEQAELDANAALERADGVDHLARMLAYGSQHLAFRLQQGRGAEVVDLVRFAIHASPDLAAMRCVLALALAQRASATSSTDAVREAQGLFDELVADDFAVIPEGIGWTVSMACLAEACCELGDSATAARLIPLLEPHREAFIVTSTAGPAGACWGPFSALLGSLHSCVGDRVAATRDFEHAFARLECFDAPMLVDLVSRTRERRLGRVPTQGV